MQIIIDNETYNVIVTRKNIKNMYLRVKDDLSISISANYLITPSLIEKFLISNKNSIKKMIEQQKKRKTKKEKIFILGEEKEIVEVDSLSHPFIDENKIYINKKNFLDKYLKTYAETVFKERLQICYNKFIEDIPFPKLKIRRMKSKWGSCKKMDNIITLNLELIKYSLSDIDYVIIHELSHFLEFNHSRKFWYYVNKYQSDYKINRKHLRE